MENLNKLKVMKQGRRGILRLSAGFVASLVSTKLLSKKASAAVQKRIKLIVKEGTIKVKGKNYPIILIEGPGGKGGYSPMKKDGFHVEVINQLKVPTSIHWHGLILPWSQDGVAFVSQNPIPPGGSQSYDFPLVQSGTNWMHTHYGLQEGYLAAAPLVIWTPEELAIADQQYVVELEDFNSTPPSKILNDLVTGNPNGSSAMSMGSMGGMGNSQKMELITQKWDKPNQRFVKDRVLGEPAEVDVLYNALLANKKTIDNPDILDVKAGKSVLLRIIAATGMTNFYIDTGKLEATMVAVDGAPTIPTRGNFFQLANAQRIDLKVQIPKNGGAFPIIAQGEGTRLLCGVVLATKGASIPTLPEIAPLKTVSLNSLQDFHSRPKDPLAKRPVNRKLELVLGGSMTGYRWTINGSEYPNQNFLSVKKGERVSIRYKNTNTMGHPMHLHGHYVQVVEVGGVPVSGPVRDTVFVPPKSEVVVEFDATNAGVWAFHCHLIYHAHKGMFTVLKYEGADTKYWQPNKVSTEKLGLRS